ncbi:MAG: hypothetical protein WB755_16010, partial [Terriglobales bacterium]
AVTLVIVPTFAPYNQVLLLPAVFLIAASWRNLWGRSRLTRAACGVGGMFVIWPWLASSSLMVGSLFLPAAAVQRAWAAPLYTSLGIPLAVLGLFSMCARDALKASPSDLQLR